MTFLEKAQRQVCGEQGAEIVEWVLWVGGIAILAGAMYTVLAGSLSTAVVNLLANIGVTGS
jgi:hypothetical protein